MNHLYELISSRRTIHEFEPDRLPPADLILKGLELACWAPNHHHVEPWQFYLPGPLTQAAICQLNAECVASAKGELAAEKKLVRWQCMPGWLVVTSARAVDPVREQENYAACCCAVQNLALYLWEHGVGLKWSTGDVTRSEKFMQLLGADAESERVVGLFWYGYPQVVPKMSRRPATESIKELP